MLVNTEKRLTRSKATIKLFNEQINDFISRGVLKLFSKSELKKWNGPIHYLSTHEIYKEDVNATTPVRLVVNSAMLHNGRFLNSMLMKGPASLNDLYSILVKFRSYPVGLVEDVSKMYQSIEVTEVEWHTRRILWRNGEVECEPNVYCLTTVTYGDVCVGCIATTALRTTAKMYAWISEEASKKLIDDTYVDDVTTGGDNRYQAELLRDNMIKIGKEGGFNFTEWTISGDRNKHIDILGTREYSKVLGCLWNTEDDTWRFKAKVNHFDKYKGARRGPNLNKEEIGDLPEHLSKRIALRLVNTVYDPIGLIVPFTIKLKLEMRKLYLEENNYWIGTILFPNI